MNPFPAGPVRKIGPKHRGVTGVVPKLGRYESGLERDFMEILRFDMNIARFTPQPLTINYFDQNGEKQKYTPDGLIFFQSFQGYTPEPILFEVKYRIDLRKDRRTLFPKFRAAKECSIQKGWRFEIFTEREIRTPYLSNVRFLWPYRERIPDPAIARRVLLILSDLDEADPDLLLCALAHDKLNRAFLIPVIWHLVATGQIDCDLDVPLTMRTLLRTQGECWHA
jgi:hypothetical protein